MPTNRAGARRRKAGHRLRCSCAARPPCSAGSYVSTADGNDWIIESIAHHSGSKASALAATPCKCPSAVMRFTVAVMLRTGMPSSLQKSCFGIGPAAAKLSYQRRRTHGRQRSHPGRASSPFERTRCAALRRAASSSAAAGRRLVHQPLARRASQRKAFEVNVAEFSQITARDL